jgi:hypothetical protein
MESGIQKEAEKHYLHQYIISCSVGASLCHCHLIHPLAPRCILMVSVSDKEMETDIGLGVVWMTCKKKVMIVAKCV